MAAAMAWRSPGSELMIRSRRRKAPSTTHASVMAERAASAPVDAHQALRRRVGVLLRLASPGGLGGPLVGVGEFGGGEGAVLVLELGYGGQAGPDGEFLILGRIQGAGGCGPESRCWSLR